MTLNSSGVRDFGQVLSISKDTVISVLKKTLKTNPYFLTSGEINMLDALEVEIRFEGEMMNFGVTYKIKPINAGHGTLQKEKVVVYLLGITGKDRIRIF